LAEEVTRLVHGEEGLAAAKRITEALFSGNESELSEGDYQQLAQDGLPSSKLPEDLSELSLVQLLTDAGMAASGKQVKDALGRNAVIINGGAKGMDDNMKTQEAFAESAARFNQYYLVKLGKKKYQLFYR
jgi:tyrosyl-tRNA synthetase